MIASSEQSNRPPELDAALHAYNQSKQKIAHRIMGHQPEIEDEKKDDDATAKVRDEEVGELGENRRAIKATSGKALRAQQRRLMRMQMGGTSATVDHNLVQSNQSHGIVFDECAVLHRSVVHLSLYVRHGQSEEKHADQVRQASKEATQRHAIGLVLGGAMRVPVATKPAEGHEEKQQARASDAKEMELVKWRDGSATLVVQFGKDSRECQQQ